MEKIKLISPYDCLVVSNGQHVFLQAHQILSLQENEKIAIYPIARPNCPAFCVDTDCQEDSRFFKVCISSYGKYFCLTDGTRCENIQVHKVSLPDGECTISLSQEQLIFEYLHFKKVVTLQSKFDKYKILVENGFAEVLLTCRKKQELFIFSSLTGDVKMLQGDEIRINGSNILLFNAYENIARQNITEEYFLSTDGLARKDRQISYQSGKPIIVSSQAVVYAFLQALQVGDGDLAMSYLDITMRRRIDNEHLLAFFGDILSFEPIEEQIYLIFSSEQNGLFKFTLNENKIVEIEKID